MPAAKVLEDLDKLEAAMRELQAQAREVIDERMAQLAPLLTEYAELLELQAILPPKRRGRPPAND